MEKKKKASKSPNGWLFHSDTNQWYNLNHFYSLGIEKINETDQYLVIAMTSDGDLIHFYQGQLESCKDWLKTFMSQ